MQKARGSISLETVSQSLSRFETKRFDSNATTDFILNVWT